MGFVQILRIICAYTTFIDQLSPFGTAEHYFRRIVVFCFSRFPAMKKSTVSTSGGSLRIGFPPIEGFLYHPYLSRSHLLFPPTRKAAANVDLACSSQVT